MRRRGPLPLPVVLGLVLVAGLCALLALNTASAAAELKQRTLNDAIANTSDTEQQLMRDLAAKQAPDALASAAVAQGLVPNPNPAFLRINADGSVTVLGQPVPASEPPPPPAPAKPTTATPAATAKPTGAAKPTATARPTATAPGASTPPGTATPHTSPTPTNVAAPILGAAPADSGGQ